MTEQIKFKEMRRVKTLQPLENYRCRATVNEDGLVLVYVLMPKFAKALLEAIT